MKIVIQITDEPRADRAAFVSVLVNNYYDSDQHEQGNPSVTVSPAEKMAAVMLEAVAKLKPGDLHVSH